MLVSARMLVLHMWLLAATATQRSLRAHLRPARLGRALCAAANVRPTEGEGTAAGTPTSLPGATAKERRTHVLQLCHDLRAEEAVACIQRIEHSGEPIPTFIYNSLIIACADQRALVQSLVERMWSGALRADDGTYSALVRNFVHWGDLGRAVRVLHRMREKGMVIRRRVVQPLIERLCTQGRARAAVRVLQRTEHLGVMYAAEDFAMMLEACCRAGELGHVEPLLVRLRDECDDRLPDTVLTTVERALGAARFADGSACFELARVQIGADELRCTHCDTELVQLRLSDEQRRQVRERLVERARAVDPTGLLTQSLEAIEAWLARSPPYDCVIDGPNVAYDDQNFVGGRFNYYQVEDMRQRAQAMGLRPMLVMPVKYMPSNFPQARIPNHTRRQRHAMTDLSIEELLIIEHWRQLDVVFEAELSGKDDWVWIYASLLGNGRLVVTNDEMRDHWLHLLEHRLFRRWKEAQIIRFQFARQGNVGRDGCWSINMREPRPWAHATQRAENGVWHLAAASGDGWLCAQPLGELPPEPLLRAPMRRAARAVGPLSEHCTCARAPDGVHRGAGGGGDLRAVFGGSHPTEATAVLVAARESAAAADVVAASAADQEGGAAAAAPSCAPASLLSAAPSGASPPLS